MYLQEAKYSLTTLHSFRIIPENDNRLSRCALNATKLLPIAAHDFVSFLPLARAGTGQTTIICLFAHR